ncbi:hypothetical protein GTY65_24080 [Streptomyces sp. SID8379]|uniref:hypothetical protein n=1 Tax=unclassified Streptomyces TaxID=2593676 RepID=UPI000380EF99|nr:MULTISPECIES: hypothetical protein [unclassified Streptomyces]MYW67122.1 hypothetical protein [Streptomyces sp. SID8379]
MDGLVSLAPVLAPLFGMLGALGGAWLVYRQGKKNSEATAVKNLTDGFTSLLEQQRASTQQTLERMTTLEAKYETLERSVEELREEQRKWRRWKAAAVEYIHDLQDVIRAALNRPAPAPPDEIASDITGPDWS